MHIPRATYRIQFNPAFGFSQAREVIPYLAELGISHLYASPIFKARQGSAHGYDIVDPNQLNPELGTTDDFLCLRQELSRQGLFWLQDIVPNHMAYDSQNHMLMDILENGKDSEYFNFFDIDWDHAYENMKGRVLTPVLGKFYAEALESKEIQLRYGEEGITINYYSLSLPLYVGSYARVLGQGIDLLEERLGGEKTDFIKLLGAIGLFKALASREGDIAQSQQVRHAKKMLWDLYCGNAQIRQFIDGNIAFFNGDTARPESFDLLDKLISEQLFRLSFWKVASEEINYRRFFTVNELISVRVEEEAVFRHTHALIFKLIEEKAFDALRVDHIDGLWDPADYLNRLRANAGDAYIVVEKILAPGERLSSLWPVQGTTGYEFMDCLNNLFCRGDNKKAFTRLYQAFTGLTAPFEELLCEKKRMIISKHLAGNVDNLAHLIKKISSNDKYGRDITLYGLKRALVEIMASFPVYRTYINYQAVGEQDLRFIQQAVQEAEERLPGFFYELNFIEKFLLLKYNGSLSDADKGQWINFAMNFQQYTGPLMAKGFEDTMLYIYNRLISLNEVGTDPRSFGCPVEKFHDFNRQGSRNFSLNATSTHDTKRGEDVRARINVLSELVPAWEEKIKQWAKINRKKKSKVDGKAAPDENDEYFLYQTLLGALPFDGPSPDFAQRIKQYIIKAVREAKRHTAWIRPDTEYEQACVAFVEGVLSPAPENEFLRDLLPFQKKIAHYGMLNSLSQVLLKLTCPGVPDFYQGCELWDLNLVDPDNRRPVDFGERIRMLADIGEKARRDIPGAINEFFLKKEDGRLKLFLIFRALQFRKEKPDIFEKGSYLPLQVKGQRGDNVIAFARQHAEECVLIIAPRFFVSLSKEDALPLGEQVWLDTRIELPAGLSGQWQDIFTGQAVSGEDDHLAVGKILRHCTVSLLKRMS